jgi:tRNA modification GTPase
MKQEECIFALATPWGESAIAVIRLSGKNTFAKLSKIFKGRKNLNSYKSHTINFGTITDKIYEIDKVLIAVYKAPNSYTGEDSAEIFCHGGLAIIQSILNLLSNSGFRSANPGEFTQRAFLNGKMDLTRAEAVNEIIRSKTDKARSLALNRLSGIIKDRIDKIKNRILQISASIEVHLDYPDEELEDNLINPDYVDNIINELDKLNKTYRTGRIFQEGISIAIAGKTNAGKSTLFNLLLKEDRAIVSDIHGTTRDYLEGLIAIRGIPIRLFDTAGLRKAEDNIEKQGIKRTEEIIANAALVIFVLDAADKPKELELPDKYKENSNVITVINKIDIADCSYPDNFICISAKTGEGLEKLNEGIYMRIMDTGSVETGEPVIDSLRQKNLIEKCYRSITNYKNGRKKNMPLDVLAVDIKDALDALGEITGEITTMDILETIFNNFCVGK